MTLVVAKIEGERIAIAADTMVTAHDKPLPVQEGTIKSCMLPGNICVSFCNSPDTAGRAFRAYAIKYPTGTDFSNTLNFFEESSKETGNDYLVAFASPAKLIKIKDGERIKSISTMQWIGDQAAYSLFREYAAGKIKKPQTGRAINAVIFADELEGSPASDLFSAMRYVAIDTSSSSVGGFISVVSNRDGAFRYSVYSDMLYDWPETKDERYNFQHKDRIDFQVSGENAKYAVAQISSGFLSLNLVAFYYTKARKLFLFYGRANSLPDQCHVFQEVSSAAIYKTLNNFVRDNLKEPLGNDLKWLMMITSPYNSDCTAYETSTLEMLGSRFSFFCEVNTFPKSSL